MQPTVHTTAQATPMQLVFGCDVIMNITFDANWHLIEQHNQNTNNQRNAKENKKQIAHTYKVDDLVLVKNEQSSKCGKDTFYVPWTIQEVQDNGTVKISKDPVTNRYICTIFKISPPMQANHELWGSVP